MANPQKENGYVPIANEIFEALARIRIPGEARQMLDVIIRKTYGFNKKSDRISTTQFINLTGLSRGVIYKARRKLKVMNLITIYQKVGSQVLSYSFQKDYKKWKLSPKKETVSKKVDSCLQKGRLTISKKVDNIHKRHFTKDTLQKTSIPFEEIINYLNSKIGSVYKAASSLTQEKIRARWSEGFKLQDFQIVIDNKADWIGTEHEKYLRPETLFGRKFEGYLNEKRVQKKDRKWDGNKFV